MDCFDQLDQLPVGCQVILPIRTHLEEKVGLGRHYAKWYFWEGAYLRGESVKPMNIYLKRLALQSFSEKSYLSSKKHDAG